ncbi:MAG: nucleotidyltransferase domain-containing protein [Planctomycetota bacterium]
MFGSNARGDATDESDIDVLGVTNSDDWRVGDAIRRFGYDLDAEIGCKLSIQVLPVTHMRYLAENQFSFYRHVTRDGVSL